VSGLCQFTENVQGTWLILTFCRYFLSFGRIWIYSILFCLHGFMLPKSSREVKDEQGTEFFDSCRLFSSIDRVFCCSSSSQDSLCLILTTANTGVVFTCSNYMWERSLSFRLFPKSPGFLFVHFCHRGVWWWGLNFFLASRLSHTSSLFCSGYFLKMGFLELLALGVLEPWASQSQPLKYLGLQAWAIRPRFWFLVVQAFELRTFAC
jgi:hypothetical protein